MTIRFIQAFVLMLMVCTAQAHQSSNAYLQVKRDGSAVSLRWDVALADLNIVLALDQNSDQALTRDEVSRQFGRIQSYLLGALQLSAASEPCTIGQFDASLNTIKREIFFRLAGELLCTTADQPLNIRYQLFEQIDPDHRALLTAGEQRTILTPGPMPVQIVSDESRQPAYIQSVNAVRSGIHHILIGWDHLAFVLALMMAATYRRAAGRWAMYGSKRACLRRAAVLTGAFTIGHSVTLALATLKIVVLPVQSVEVVIGASIAVTALIALFASTPSQGRSNRIAAPIVASVFGLIHGFGFAAVLDNSGASGWAFANGLFMFNMGVELGQLAVLCVLLPILWLIGRYRSVLAIYAPAAYTGLLLLGGFLAVQRAL